MTLQILVIAVALMIFTLDYAHYFYRVETAAITDSRSSPVAPSKMLLAYSFGIGASLIEIFYYYESYFEQLVVAVVLGLTLLAVLQLSQMLRTYPRYAVKGKITSRFSRVLYAAYRGSAAFIMLSCGAQVIAIIVKVIFGNT